MDEIGLLTTLWMAIAVFQSILLFYSARLLGRWQNLVDRQQLIIEEMLREQAKLLHPHLVKSMK